jgi:drug/metabolite transporter (DMT)-like permease
LSSIEKYLSIMFGLGAAVAWGAGDFVGGLASRKASALRVVMYGEFVGFALLVVVSLLFPQRIPEANVFLLAAAAGVAGSLGLLCLYHSMAVGQMSIAAPVSALLAALLPVVVGAFTEGLPKPTQFIGFGCALGAVWLISQNDGTKPRLERLADLRVPLAAGLCFGAYFVLMHLATRNDTLVPMITSRGAGAAFLALFVALRREGWGVPRAAWGLVGANGVIDVLGNFFYILAGQAGRLDVAAVLSALYPGGTVILARLILKERINWKQTIGILAALTAIALMTR